MRSWRLRTRRRVGVGAEKGGLGALTIAHPQAHLSELRLAHTSARVTELERSARVTAGGASGQRPASQPASSQPARSSERNYWRVLRRAALH